MRKRVAIIQGHPSAGGGHFCHALADAYGAGARASGHEVRTIAVAEIEFPLLRTREEWESEPPPAIAESQQIVAWAEHLVVIYPLWLGGMPALLKGFFEQVARPAFAFREGGGHGFPRGKLTGKSARIVVTMGMPALIYRWYFGAHSLRSLERNILKFAGIRPVRASLIGLVEGNPARRQRWLERMRALGRAAR